MANGLETHTQVDGHLENVNVTDVTMQLRELMDDAATSVFELKLDDETDAEIFDQTAREHNRPNHVPFNNAA